VLTGAVTCGSAITVSTVKVTEAGEPVLPDGSVILTESVCIPSTNEVVVTDHTPFSPTIPVPTTLPLASTIVTVEPAGSVVVPEMVGVYVGSDCGGEAVGDGDVMTGASGAVMSIVTVNTADVALLPAASVDVAVMLCVPSANTMFAIDHAPLASAVVVPMDTPLSNTSTVLSASAVPVIVCV